MHIHDTIEHHYQIRKRAQYDAEKETRLRNERNAKLLDGDRRLSEWVNIFARASEDQKQHMLEVVGAIAWGYES